MEYLKQFGIILAVSFMGEALRAVLPFPVPASVYGLVLLFAFLLSGVLKTEQVNGAARFLIEIMPVMFIPAAAGLLNAWDTLLPVLLPVSLITVLTTVLVMGVTGSVAQGVMGNKKRRARKRGKA